MKSRTIDILDIAAALDAVALEGYVLQCLPPEFRTEAVCLAAVST
ncbi:MAG: hypothetical protein H6R01_2043, partial [Burkholderiaceae bacterium]|nr:hypothetical protein [Burkholderiaceae bacterium]